MSDFKPRRLTPEESANAWAEGERRSDELRQQTAKMRLPPVGAELEVAQLRLQLSAANEVALSALERAKGLQAEVDRMAPEFEAILAVNDGLRAEVAAKDAAYLGGAPTEAEALQMRLDAAEAEVAAWRRAVSWKKTDGMIYVLRFDSPEVGRQYDLAAVSKYPDGWIGWVDGRFQRGPLPDRNAVCAKACELLGIPVVLPVGGE